MQAARTLPQARRRGRRATMAVYYTVVAVFGAVSAAEISWQVWAHSFVPASQETCDPGLRKLVRAVDRAREAASTTVAGGETAAIARFRAALSPEWDRHDAIAASCGGDPRGAAALDAIERLRYAEEHAVRRNVAELAPLRRTVAEFVKSRDAR